MARSIAFPNDANYQVLSGNIDPAVDGVTYHNFGAGADYEVKLPNPASVAVRQGYSFRVICPDPNWIVSITQPALQKIKADSDITSTGVAGKLGINYGSACVVTYFGSDFWMLTEIVYFGGISVY